MNLKYRFGKGNYRNLSEGIEREWLIANGIGGFGKMLKAAVAKAPLKSI